MAVAGSTTTPILGILRCLCLAGALPRRPAAACACGSAGAGAAPALGPRRAGGGTLARAAARVGCAAGGTVKARVDAVGANTAASAIASASAVPPAIRCGEMGRSCWRVTAGSMNKLELVGTNTRGTSLRPGASGRARGPAVSVVSRCGFAGYHGYARAGASLACEHALLASPRSGGVRIIRWTSPPPTARQPAFGVWGRGVSCHGAAGQPLDGGVEVGAIGGLTHTPCAE